MSADRRVDFIILEKEHQVGSSWRRHYERLHVHTIKSRSSLPFRSFDRNYPRYVPRALVVRYLEEYAASFDLKPHFGENVHAVRKQGNEWLIESTSKAFSAPNLVVATGLNAEPVTPHYPGAEKFRGLSSTAELTSMQHRSRASAFWLLAWGIQGRKSPLTFVSMARRRRYRYAAAFISSRAIFWIADPGRGDCGNLLSATKNQRCPFWSFLISPLETYPSTASSGPSGHFGTSCQVGENSSLRCWNSEINSRRTEPMSCGA